MAAGTARIISAGGSLTYPTDTAYDRQQLVEHVLVRVRRDQDLKLRVDGIQWLVQRPDSQACFCSSCTCRIDSAVCHRTHSTRAYCVACAVARPELTIAFLLRLPATVMLRDVQAHYAYGGEWIPWMRWPQATPAEIIGDMRLQRRFAPVLVWHCAEILRQEADSGTSAEPPLSLKVA